MYNNFNWTGWNMTNNLWPALGMGWSLVIIFLAIWSLVWKGMALWKAARKGETTWFIALLVVNTVGILDILYLYVFSERSKSVK